MNLYYVTQKTLYET